MYYLENPTKSQAMLTKLIEKKNRQSMLGKLNRTENL
jgi:hypothetical protein